MRVELEGDARIASRNERDLQRLVLNLIDNAAKHSPNGSVVRVTLSSSPDVELAVEDQGPGVPAADLERIFEPFFRGEHEDSEDGSGLGLAIVRAIARAHDGEVSVDARNTRRGQGARFVVRFAAP